MTDQRSPDVRQYTDVATVRPYAPSTRRPTRTAPEERIRERRVRRTATKLVLLINGDRDTRLIFSSILERKGYEVSSIDSVDSGLRLARRRRPALIIADSTAKVADRQPLSRALRDDPRTREIALLTLTVEPMPKELREMADDETARCLAVPVSPGRLVREVRMLIGPSGEEAAQPEPDSGSAA